MQGEVFDTKGPKVIVESKARKEALPLCLSPLPISMDIVSTVIAIYKIIGGTNVMTFGTTNTMVLITMEMQMCFVLTLLSIEHL